MAPRTARALPWASRALRAGVYLVLGGVIAAGYGVLVSGLVQLARAAPQVPMALTVALTVIAVPLALVPPFLAPVRDLGIAAARTFLDVDLPTTSARLGHDDRLRAAGYFVAHLLTGALATLALLFGIPYAVGLIGWTLGSRGDGFRLSAPDLGSAFASAAGSIADAEGSRPIYLNVNGRTLATVTAADTRRAQNIYNRTIALGVGK